MVLHNSPTTKRRLFKQFEFPDLIPYSIALLFFSGCVYLLTHLPHISF